MRSYPLTPGRAASAKGQKLTSEATKKVVRYVPLTAVSRCSELSYETGQWSIRGLRPKSKTAWGHTLHTAHDAPLAHPGLQSFSAA